MHRAEYRGGHALADHSITIDGDGCGLPVSRQIELTEAFRERHPHLAASRLFNTTFHAKMPRVTTLLPISRRYQVKGVQQYGFHGLSYAYLLEELARGGGPAAAHGRVILAHLGNGASLAAVQGGMSIDTKYGFRAPTS